MSKSRKRESGFTPARALVLVGKLALLLVITAVFCELMLRVVVRFELLGKDNSFIVFMKYGNRKFHLEGHQLFRYSSNIELGWEAVPGATFQHLRINKDGFRGRDYPAEPPEGVRRIAFVGDSETFGRHLLEEDTVAGILEEELNSRAGTGTKYEVLNFGIPGLNTRQELEMLTTKALKYKPSVVVLYYVLNDPELAERTLLFSDRGILSNLYIDNLRLFLKVGFQRIRFNPNPTTHYYQKLHDSVFFESCKKLIRQMGEITSERGIRFIMLISPEVVGVKNLDKDYPYHNIHEKLMALSSGNIEVVDPIGSLAPMWDEANPKKLWVLEWDPHKNPVANRAIGKRLADHIMKDAQPSGGK